MEVKNNSDVPNITKLQQLSQGGTVILDKECVSPLSNMYQAVKEVLSNDKDNNITMQLDGKKLVEILNPYITK